MLRGMEWLAAVLLLGAAGWLGGLLAGLFGVGMGVALVPAMVAAAPLLGVAPAVAVKLALGTSLALTVPTSALAAWRQHRAGRLDQALFRAWLPGMAAGVLAGTLAAAVVPAEALALLFGVLALAVAACLAAPQARLRDAPPAVPALPAAVGGLSVLMGVGGGTLGVPAMSLFGVPIGRAVATAAAFGVVVSAPATLGLVVAGWGAAGRPWGSLGWVSLPVVALVLPLALWAAPMGVRLAEQARPLLLRRAFALFMALVGCRMLLA